MGVGAGVRAPGSRTSLAYALLAAGDDARDRPSRSRMGRYFVPLVPASAVHWGSAGWMRFGGPAPLFQRLALLLAGAAAPASFPPTAPDLALDAPDGIARASRQIARS